MDKFDVILNNAMNLIDFKFEKDSGYFNKIFVSNSNPKHIIVYDLLHRRFGFYFDRTFKEQFFICTSDDKRTFRDWLKNTARKSPIEITALRVKEYIDKIN